MNVLWRKKLREMILEDQGFSDLTSRSVPDKKVDARITAKDSAVLAGEEVLRVLFDDFSIEVLDSMGDGAFVSKDDVVFYLSGSSSDLLLLERTALNILTRMSAIASYTRKFVDEAGDVKIAGTRKTTPLFSCFEKEAIRIGGGDPHRFNLMDCILIKDNHLVLYESISQAVDTIREQSSFVHKISVEASNKDQAIQAARKDVDIILLDNMSPDEIMDTISDLCGRDFICQDRAKRKIIIEASGDIGLDDLREYAESGVDVISVGALTHSAPSKNFSMRVLNSKRR